MSITGILVILFGLLSGFLFLSFFYKKIHLDKLVILCFGLLLSFVAIFGFFLSLPKWDLSTTNVLACLILLTIGLYYARRKYKLKKPDIIFDLPRSITLGVIFLASFMFYIYPALPTMFSPCIPGSDCTHHIEYSQGIYEHKKLEPPIVEWDYYPLGLHINVAFAAEALTDSKPDYTNMFYPFMALITALNVTILCAIILESTKRIAYALLLAVALLLLVYPASALIQYGFWAQVFGTFFAILFFWVLGDYINKTGTHMWLLLGIIAVASYLAYQILPLAPLLIGFLMAALTVPKTPFKQRVVSLALFMLFCSLFIGLNTFENYSKYLKSDREPFLGSATIYQTINMTNEERHSINEKSFGEFQIMLKRQLEQQGSVIFFDGLNRFGLVIIFLSIVGLLLSKGFDAPVVYFSSALFELLVFQVGFENRIISWYYLSKIGYFTAYAFVLIAVFGFAKLIEHWGVFQRPLKLKRILSGVVILILVGMVLYVTHITADAGLFFGENKLVFNNVAAQDWTNWPLIRFNRIDLYSALQEKREPYKYNVFEFLQGKKFDPEVEKKR